MRQENLKNNRDILLETRNLSVEFPMKKKSFLKNKNAVCRIGRIHTNPEGRNVWTGRGERLRQINVCQCNAWFCKAPVGRNLF